MDASGVPTRDWVMTADAMSETDQYRRLKAAVQGAGQLHALIDKLEREQVEAAVRESRPLQQSGTELMEEIRVWVASTARLEAAKPPPTATGMSATAPAAAPVDYTAAGITGPPAPRPAAAVYQQRQQKHEQEMRREKAALAKERQAKEAAQAKAQREEARAAGMMQAFAALGAIWSTTECAARGLTHTELSWQELRKGTAKKSTEAALGASAHPLGQGEWSVVLDLGATVDILGEKHVPEPEPDGVANVTVETVGGRERCRDVAGRRRPG